MFPEKPLLLAYLLDNQLLFFTQLNTFIRSTLKHIQEGCPSPHAGRHLGSLKVVSSVGYAGAIGLGWKLSSFLGEFCSTFSPGDWG